jgi:hypothetical integral membrane protein (TIGR02206 family)
MAIGSPFHLLMIGAVAVLSILVVQIGRRSHASERIARIIGFALLATWVVYNVYYFQPAVFAWERSLPLHVCDILALLTAVILLKPIPIGRGVVCLSAIPLASQAILTPTGDHNPAAWRFWLYWVLHTGIIAGALFDVIVRRYTPTLRDYVTVVVVDIAYVAVLLPIDIAYRWNYGYIGDAVADGRTVVDVLGPWPLRVFIMTAIVMSVQLLMLIAVRSWRAVSSRRQHARGAK